ncbi:putative tetratricopeptide-like helical domain-containing protein [Tanacetum coccineum]
MVHRSCLPSFYQVLDNSGSLQVRPLSTQHIFIWIKYKWTITTTKLHNVRNLPSLHLATAKNQFIKDTVWRKYLKVNYNCPLEDSVDFEDSLALFRFMDENKLNSNIDVYNILIDRASMPELGRLQVPIPAHKVKEAKDVIDLMVDSGRYLDIVIFNSLIDGYSLLGDMTQARSIFDLLRYRGLRANETDKVNDCLRVLGSCLEKAGQHSPAGCKLTELEEEYRNLLKGDDGCTFEDSFALFQFMDENKLNSNTEVYNILIDRASICLKFDTARHLFHDLIVKGLKPEIKTYTVMISFFRA